MKRVILFRFHSCIDICRDRLQLLRQLNPTVPIYGLFGGDPADVSTIARRLSPDLVHIAYPKGSTQHCNWANGDLLTRAWFRKVGRHIDFDVLHLIEWDLLLLSPLEVLYRHVPKLAVALSGVRKVKDVDHQWDPWLTQAPLRAEWEGLLDWAQTRYSMVEEPLCCFFPGPAFPHAFLSAYSAVTVPSYCHDELRLPFFAQLLGFAVCDTGFCKEWSSPEERKYFNCNGIDIEHSTIETELKERFGRRAFHPFREKWFDDIRTHVGGPDAI